MSPRLPFLSRRKENPVAKTVLGFYGGRPQYRTTNVEAYAREAYMGNPDVFAAVETLATACAGVSWYAESKVRGVWQRTEEHDLLTLWNRPNPRMGNTRFIGDLVRWQCIAGESYAARNEKPTGAPKELWVLPPSRVKILPGRDLVEMVAGYEYEIGGCKQTLAASDVLHLAMFNPLDDFYGMSPLAAAAKLVDQASAAADYNLALLQNGGIPPLFLTTQEELGDEEFKAFKKEMHTSWMANKNVGLPQLLEGGMDVKTVGVAPKDMQMLEAQRMFALKFAQVLRVPAEFLSGAEEKKYGNYGDALKALYTEGALPRLDLIQDDANAWLSPMFGDGVRLRYDRDDVEALKEDQDKLWTRVNAATHLTVDEKRDLTGQAAYTGGGGDKILVPFGLSPIDELGDSPDPVEEAPAEDDPQGKSMRRKAAEADHAGAMVALYLPPEVAEQVAVEGGEAAEQLHITLAYFEDAGNARDDWPAVHALITNVARKHLPLAGALNGQGVFHTPESDAHWAAVDVPGLEAMREELVTVLDLAGFPVRKDHGFTPHVTVLYDAERGAAPELAAETVAVAFDEVVLAVGGDRTALKRYTPAPRSKALNIPDAQKAAYWKLVDGKRLRLEKDVTKRFEKQIAADTDAVVAAISGAPTPPAARARMEKALDAQAATWSKLLGDVYVTVGKPFAEDTLAQLKTDAGPDVVKALPDAWVGRVRAYLEQHGAAKVTNILDTTKAKVSAQIDAGIEEWEGIPDIAKRVRTAMEGISASRSRTIARTETVSASNAASMSAAESTGLPLEKEWISTADDKTRDTHQDVEAVGMDEPFVLASGDTLMFPGDSGEGADAGEIVNCRCTQSYRVLDA